MEKGIVLKVVIKLDKFNCNIERCYVCNKYKAQSFLLKYIDRLIKNRGVECLKYFNIDNAELDIKLNDKLISMYLEESTVL